MFSSKYNKLIALFMVLILVIAVSLSFSDKSDKSDTKEGFQNYSLVNLSDFYTRYKQTRGYCTPTSKLCPRTMQNKEYFARTPCKGLDKRIINTVEGTTTQGFYPEGQQKDKDGNVYIICMPEGGSIPYKVIQPPYKYDLNRGFIACVAEIDKRKNGEIKLNHKFDKKLEVYDSKTDTGILLDNGFARKCPDQKNTPKNMNKEQYNEYISKNKYGKRYIDNCIEEAMQYCDALNKKSLDFVNGSMKDGKRVPVSIFHRANSAKKIEISKPRLPCKGITLHKYWEEQKEDTLESTYYAAYRIKTAFEDNYETSLNLQSDTDKNNNICIRPDLKFVPFLDRIKTTAPPPPPPDPYEKGISAHKMKVRRIRAKEKAAKEKAAAAARTTTTQAKKECPPCLIDGGPCMDTEGIIGTKNVCYNIYKPTGKCLPGLLNRNERCKTKDVNS